ncbi:MAG: dephospho-CoA kinase [Bacteroidales bacterium]|nr:dephospho-CoA kinase [Bacteroidales bacterium]
MEKIALTGGIGTGKTFISRIFIKQGIPVFYADEEAKKLYNRKEVIEKIRKIFGDDVFVEEKLDFGKLAQCVFQDEVLLAKLNAIIHPLVMQEFERWAMQQNCDKVMMESALIYEADLQNYFDKVIVVNASVPVRIARIKRRNPQMSEAEIMERIHRQIGQEQKCLWADEVIEHDEDW